MKLLIIFQELTTFEPMLQRTFIFLLSFHSFGQDSFFENADTLNKNRMIVATSSIGTVWAGSIVGLSQIWYKDVEKTSWHAFNDSQQWMQMDKVGHV